MSTVIPIENALAVSILKNSKIRAYLASHTSPTSHVAPIPDHVARSILANVLITQYVADPAGHAALLTGSEKPIQNAYADSILKNGLIQAAFA
jgi:hypothetical protein